MKLFNSKKDYFSEKHFQTSGKNPQSLNIFILLVGFTCYNKGQTGGTNPGIIFFYNEIFLQ